MYRHCLMLVLLLSLQAQADPAGQRVLQCARQNLPQTEMIKQLEMTVVDRNGAARTLQGKVYARGTPAGASSALSVVIRFEAPLDLSGAAYLVRQPAGEGSEQLYMFLPAMQRVRRISGKAANVSLLGTSYSYSDFQQLESAFSGSDAALEGSVDLDGRSAQVLSMKPAGSSSPYSLVRSWIDQQSCVPVKVEFLSGSAVRKRFQAAPGALRQSGRYWYLAESTMQDLAEGSSTRLRIDKVTSGESIPSGYFEPTSFYLPN